MRQHADLIGIVRALGLHRSERALGVLLELVAHGPLATASSAMSALAARRFDMGVRARALAAAQENGDRALITAFEEIFHDVAEPSSASSP